MQKPELNQARKAALYLLNGVIDHRQQMNEVLASDAMARFAPEDRARGQRLALTTLRQMGRADKILKPHLAKRPPLAVENMLRLGLVEIAHLGAPAYGVVNDMVAICAANSRTRALKGLVNAVLRKAHQSVDGKWDKSPVTMLPKWLRNPLREAYGNGPIMTMEFAHMRGAPVDVTLKSGDPVEWAETLCGSVLPGGSIRLEKPGQITLLPGYEAGDWWIQDAAAALPARIAAAQSGERVLDLCCAPGGKTMQLAATGAAVTAVDAHEGRIARVQENLDRTKLTAQLLQADATDFAADPYDLVLLDAPCSATGTLRRHPDLPHAKDGSNISELIELQAKMLQNAAKLVKPGGRLIFCTCSLFPDEGEVQVEEFLAAHSDFSADIAALNQPGIDPAWQTEEGGLRLRPDYWGDLGGMDGFYIARLNRAE